MKLDITIRIVVDDVAVEPGTLARLEEMLTRASDPLAAALRRAPTAEEDPNHGPTKHPA
jgi:hypothetical protein